jgi:glycosyltransferase involved in cell wall biosynthesis
MKGCLVMNAESQPLVSVVTPVYNMASFLPECIESVLNQTYTNFEYLIVNNCSTDRTLEVALDYAKKDSRIRVHNNREFLGVIANHNLAFSVISPKAKYCKVVSADDFIFPECIMRLVELAELNPSVGMVGSYFLAGKLVMCDGLEYERKVVNGREICRATLRGGPYVFGSPTSLLYRADLVRRSKAFYPHDNPHADTTACYQSLEHSDFGFVHQVLSWARIHPDSQTSRSLKFGTFGIAVMSDLTRFGPKYLNPVELKQRVEYFLDSYYRVLVHVLFSRSGNKQFWQQQKAALQEIDLRFSVARLLKTALLMGFGLLLKPSVAVKRILALKRDAGKVEARYYRTDKQELYDQDHSIPPPKQF